VQDRDGDVTCRKVVTIKILLEIIASVVIVIMKIVGDEMDWVDENDSRAVAESRIFPR
jgi:hypothetical protein